MSEHWIIVIADDVERRAQLSRGLAAKRFNVASSAFGAAPRVLADCIVIVPGREVTDQGEWEGFFAEVRLVPVRIAITEKNDMESSVAAARARASDVLTEPVTVDVVRFRVSDERIERECFGHAAAATAILTSAGASPFLVARCARVLAKHGLHLRAAALVRDLDDPDARLLAADLGAAIDREPEALRNVGRAQSARVDTLGADERMRRWRRAISTRSRASTTAVRRPVAIIRSSARPTHSPRNS